jgi:hypothetical protein
MIEDCSAIHLRQNVAGEKNEDGFCIVELSRVVQVSSPSPEVQRLHDLALLIFASFPSFTS